ncbi:MAG: alpha/beta fold hydrolase [Flavobacteriaceae bacterium]|jgi:phospholipase/carboxylesterase|nr:alpha/beta fold hydrolase [Flavobacteriaceae bacterium]
MELHYLVREPEIITPKTPVLFMLHGYGSNEEDLFSFTPNLPEDWLIISFRAPKGNGYGGFSWYNIDFLESGKIINVPQAEESLSKILKDINEIREKYRISEGETHLCGFSQGGILCYALALSHPEKFTKVACLSSYPEEEILTQIIKDKKQLQHLRFFVSHGTDDAVIPLEWGRRAADLLYDLGCYFSFREYMCGHGLNQKNYIDLMEFFEVM